VSVSFPRSAAFGIESQQQHHSSTLPSLLPEHHLSQAWGYCFLQGCREKESERVGKGEGAVSEGFGRREIEGLEEGVWGYVVSTAEVLEVSLESKG